MNGSHEGAGQLVVTGGDSSERFEPAHPSLHAIATPIKFPIMGNKSATIAWAGDDGVDTGATMETLKSVNTTCLRRPLRVLTASSLRLCAGLGLLWFCGANLG